MSHRLAEILLVEDNAGDVRLTREALKRGKIANTLHVVGDGVAAMRFLRRDAPYDDAPRPDLVLLDLNLPKKSGIEVLAEVKGDTDLKRIPIAVLTTSSSEDDVLRSYELHANCYITKPVQLAQFLEVVTQLEDFWLGVVRPPPA